MKIFAHYKERDWSGVDKFNRIVAKGTLSHTLLREAKLSLKVQFIYRGLLEVEKV